MKNNINVFLKNKQAQLFLTEMCNLNCDGCPYPTLSIERKRDIKKREIEPERWNEIIDYLYKMGIRLFTVIGGEPCSYKGIEKIIEGIVLKKNVFVLLSTSGIHLLKDSVLRKKVGDLLSSKGRGQFKNGIAISFDSIPNNKLNDSREFKAKQGLDLVECLRNNYKDKIIYMANVMITPINLPEIINIQNFLEERGIYINLCTKQRKCFGEKTSVFNDDNKADLQRTATELIKKKIKGKLIANSITYLSQLSDIISAEEYQCWKEPEGSPIIDVAPDGIFRFCNWIGQKSKNGPPGIKSDFLIKGFISWKDYWLKSKAATQRNCKGCSWSRRDRNNEPMVYWNCKLSKIADLKEIDINNVKYKNIWVQSQLLIDN